ncbi:MAG: peptide ABC transporter substrate-binding protein [Opitutales bacterium]
MTRRLCAYPLLLLVLLAAGGCTKSDSSTRDAAVGPDGRKLMVWSVGNGTEPQDLDPQTVTGVPEHNILLGLFEGLVSEDPKTLEPVPGVAERWTISDDGLVYTFYLRNHLKWSNGEPLTADDFVQSYQRALTPSIGCKYAYMFWSVVGAKDFNTGKLTDFTKVGFKALDDRTLQFTLIHPTSFLLRMIASHYTWYPVPIKTIARFGGLARGDTPWTRPGNLVSNGPFQLKEWRPGQRIVLERNPHYWDAKNVLLDQIRFFATEDITAEERMFRTGQIDRTNELPNAKIDAYRRDYPETLRIEPYLGVYFYRLNVTRPPLNDKRVRQALALAIDRESLVKNVTRGGQRPAYAVSYPGTAGYTPTARLPGDIAKARQLLAEAGYPGGRNWPHVELLYNTSENHRAIAEAIQQMWRQNLGIDVQLANQEWKVYLNSEQNLDYWIERAGWIADYVDPNVFLEIWTTGNTNNNTGWSNPEYDRLAAAALVAKTDPARYALYQKMDAILVDELPVIPIYYYTRVYAMSPKVKGFWPNLLDDHPYKYIHIED